MHALKLCPGGRVLEIMCSLPLVFVSYVSYVSYARERFSWGLIPTDLVPTPLLSPALWCWIADLGFLGSQHMTCSSEVWGGFFLLLLLFFF